VNVAKPAKIATSSKPADAKVIKEKAKK